MNIRIKKNPSGSKSVVLVRSERRKGKKSSYTVVVKTFGSSHDDKEIELLKIEAEKYKTHLTGENKSGKEFKFKSSSDISGCQIINRSFHDIYSKIYNKIFKSLPLSTPSTNKLLKDLSILRIANPCSKRESARISKDYGCDFKVDSAYKLMDQIDEDVVSSIKGKINNHTQKTLKENRLKVDVVFYDLTTIYFEANKKDDLKQFGFSKDGKSQHVQITLALLVTNEGLPIGYELFPGNMYEGKTMPVILDKLKDNYKIKKVVVVADSGLLNQSNISILEEQDYDYIIAARIKNMKAGITSKLLASDGYKRATDEVFAKVIEYDKSSSLICCYSDKKSKKDKHEREVKLQKLINKNGKSIKNLLPSKHKKPYIKMNQDSKVIIDEKALEKEEKYDGHYAIRTNIKNPDPKNIIYQYKGLWQIERSFRIMKTDLSIRPVYHWTVDRMKAHFAICYISFAMIRYLEFDLKSKGIKITNDEVHSALSDVKTVKIKSQDNIFNISQDINENAQIIYKATNTRLPSKFKVIT